MCYYVFVSVPAHEHSTTQLLSAAGFSVRDVDNASLTEVFPNNFVELWGNFSVI
jgi:hypothetical protein